MSEESEFVGKVDKDGEFTATSRENRESDTVGKGIPWKGRSLAEKFSIATGVVVTWSVVFFVILGVLAIIWSIFF